MKDLLLYELAGDDPALRFSPSCWKTRMALAHKGLSPTTIAWRFTDTDALAFSGQGFVPVLVDEGTIVSDSWRIAQFLDSRYSEAPALFAGNEAMAMAGFINAWTDSILLPLFRDIILLDVHDCLTPADRAYFRTSREKWFGKSLEELVADQPRHLSALKGALSPLRRILKESSFLAGDAPSYADYSVFGLFMWARCTSHVQLLKDDDPVFRWRERLLSAFDSLARSAPWIGSIAAGA